MNNNNSLGKLKFGRSVYVFALIVALISLMPVTVNAAKAKVNNKISFNPDLWSNTWTKAGNKVKRLLMVASPIPKSMRTIWISQVRI